MYNEKRLRVQRASVDLTYNAAYNYWSLKGVLAERWAHGPLMGAISDSPEQTTLVPPQDGGAPRLVRAIYGLRATAFTAENETDWPAMRGYAEEWLSDVYRVLDPKRTVGVRVCVLCLHPQKGVDRASDKMFSTYLSDKVKAYFPSQGKSLLAGFQGIEIENLGDTSIRTGTVGPPHHGEFFTPRAAENNAWFMAMEMTKRQRNPEGIADPVTTAMSLYDTVFEATVSASKDLFPKVI